MEVPVFQRFLRTSRTPVDEAVDLMLAALSSSATDLDAVVQAGRTVTGEAITVQSRPQPEGQYGMCARTEVGHVIYVDPELAGDLMEHTVFHELGHIVLGHNDAVESRQPNRLVALLTGAETGCVIPDFREWAQREHDAERFAATVSRRLRRGMRTQRLSRLDEAFG